MFIVKIDSSVGAQRSFRDFLILTEKTALTLAFLPPLVAASDVIDVKIVLCFLISHGSMDNLAGVIGENPPAPNGIARQSLRAAGVKMFLAFLGCCKIYISSRGLFEFPRRS